MQANIRQNKNKMRQEKNIRQNKNKMATGGHGRLREATGGYGRGAQIQTTDDPSLSFRLGLQEQALLGNKCVSECGRPYKTLIRDL